MTNMICDAAIIGAGNHATNNRPSRGFMAVKHLRSAVADSRRAYRGELRMIYSHSARGTHTQTKLPRRMLDAPNHYDSSAPKGMERIVRRVSSCTSSVT
jgi:hypothetical protein